jgi:hypothetical protein
VLAYLTTVMAGLCITESLSLPHTKIARTEDVPLEIFRGYVYYKSVAMRELLNCMNINIVLIRHQ